MNNLVELKGLDIYLIDQVVKGAFEKEMKILDAGCGGGRNMKWFGEEGFSIVGCDINEIILEQAIHHTNLDSAFFKCAAVEQMPYTDKSFDYIISCAVLHFAKSTADFIKMIKEMYRVLKPNGQLFIRMTSIFGLPNNYKNIGNGRFLLQDGTERFLLTKELLADIKAMGFTQSEPLKTTVVEELRAMSTLVLRKV